MADRDMDGAVAGGATAGAGRHALRLAALRAELKRRGLDGFIQPRSDEYQGEYVPPSAERLRFLTGFTGSWGLVIVLAERAAIFVDGRYTLQVKDQVDPALYEHVHSSLTPPAEWLAKNAPAGARIGFDPWLHTPSELAGLGEAAKKAGAALVPVEGNPADAVWPDRPPAPAAPILPHGLEFAGRSAADKRRSVGEALAKDKTDAAVLTLPEAVAWLLNVRGGDVPRTPLPLSTAIVHADGSVDWFVDPRKIGAELEGHLGAEVRRHPPAALAGALAALAGKTVRLDPATAAQWFFDRLEAAGATIRREADPTRLAKACKNEVELAGFRAAHRRDGAAVSKFLAWVAVEAPKGGVSERAAADRLERFRRESNLLRDLSFDTISGAGPNGAIVHYRVTESTDRRLAPGELYLVDSGGQYPDGTTDVTRTVAIGAPTAEMRRHFTLVLKGHIALATARFPAGTTGSQLDAIARLALWREGLDYDHGTGHGVGHYLSVHEGPQRISKLPNTVALQPGMVVSNEPGYYKTGAYGIRIENLVAVAVVGRTESGADQLGFETLTLAPIDRALVDPVLLTGEERAWLDAYHARVRAEIGPQLDAAARAWLEAATAPL
jgi:Xaa-Pro aminopeptidase